MKINDFNFAGHKAIVRVDFNDGENCSGASGDHLLQMMKD